MKKINITENERKHYKRYSDSCSFKTAEEEYEWADSQNKICNKCHNSLPLTCFGFSTSGSFPLNRFGVRYRRGECLECKTKLLKGKSLAKSRAIKNGISITPSKSDKCVLCDSKNNLVFDHDHHSEKFRGWLCDPCNRALGTLESRLGPNWKEKINDYTN